MASIKLIVGLGNPGAQYASTRHNAGFWYVTQLAERYGIDLTADKKFKAMTGRGIVEGQDVRLLLPTTFMNNSGQSVVPFTNFYQITPQQLLIAHDELDIAAGSIKLKTGGGHGGHNGLKDIAPHLGLDFHRLRIGIDHPGHKSKVSSHVLSKPSNDDLIAIQAAIDTALDNTALLVKGDLENARNRINSFKLPI